MDRGSLSHLSRPLRFEPLEDRWLPSITVNTLFDENDGIGTGGISLREAIAAAVSGETINFSVTGTLNLTRGELHINKNLVIAGPGADLLAIDASGNDPTPLQKLGDGSRIFLVDDGNATSKRDVEIVGVTLTGGDSAQDGGGIYSQENLTIKDSVLFFNSSDKNGGGIYNAGGTLKLLASVIDSNYSRGYDTDGGAIYSYGPSIEFVDSQVSNNQALGVFSSGGGAYVFSGSVSVTGSEFSRNGAGGSGGGLLVGFSAESLPATVTDSVFTENVADSSGGGIHSSQHLIIKNALFWRNESGGPGGGISGGRLEIYNSEVSENEGSGIGGGGIEVGTALTAFKTLFDGNRASGFNASGGAILAWGATVDFVESVAINNWASSGGAIGFEFLEPITIRRSMVAFNGASRGGGIGGQGSILVEESAIFENQGSGIDIDSGSATVLRSTISSNRNAGINLRDFSRVRIEQSTLTGNMGSGISEVMGRYSAEIYGAIIAGNFDSTGAPSDYIRISQPSAGTIRYSIIGTNVGSKLSEAPIGSADAFGNLIGGPIHGLIDPKLGPLVDNGGPTWSHGLLPGSPAINTGDPAIVEGFDQRGVPWLRVYATRADVGSIEFHAEGLPGDYNRDGILSAADYVVWRKQLDAAADFGADGNGDNVIDRLDLDLWRAGFSARWPSTEGGDSNGSSMPIVVQLVSPAEMAEVGPIYPAAESPLRSSAEHSLHFADATEKGQHARSPFEEFVEFSLTWQTDLIHSVMPVKLSDGCALLISSGIQSDRAAALDLRTEITREEVEAYVVEVSRQMLSRRELYDDFDAADAAIAEFRATICPSPAMPL